MEVLTSSQVTAIPTPSLGTQEQLLESLDVRSAERWKELRDALPARFAAASMAAAKLLEPRAIRVSLPSATLRNGEDLERWIEQAKSVIEEPLRRGPVIV